ncbi:MAG TPA: hypothetical protein RMH99_24310 [Sandaracinaceae bacterium LLY-WYZ-13_1]|nr:hypothetical protein [Sandaracinaceae bacterium LLY-WYZ-13_1]
MFASIVTAGATKWLPAGRAGIDHIMVPIVAFPVVWVVFALVLYAARRRGVAWAAVAGLTAIHAALVAHGWAS